ncbi:heavy-metal-associated domain-containing protein [Thauera linaloolentis]|uniref:Copper chaperone n=1 Tax=Thauera linaloolentis (strain DSM 12138 / JCM 21573 / CCUG 41526 / CIP 105981 / IAM 15112 / NBRC 102519 / 47Lol) TaxID=1123367 RepID=N6YV16_THAL4|nr:heavy-metal-associated domain-containing protein [Thauera linaloolentis]ENO85978.1 copper chaperone [Thauera linaloolentis 47Lol = DSM 12138]MCM8567207.1 heavy-metal-associated domain-containing protein [Thauera linaloolentis]
MSSIELTVDGMKCGGCSGRLKRVLEGSDGVLAAEAAHETRRVTVDYDAGRTDPQAIRQRIEDSGFSVVA